MHSLADWSVGIGRWRGVPVRIHLLFVLLALITFYLASYVAKQDSREDLLWEAAAGLGILLASVMIHELGHIIAAVRLGGSVDEIVLGPLGGLVSPRLPAQLRQEWIADVAGPAANLLVVCLIGAPLAIAGHIELTSLLNPITPGGISTDQRLLALLQLTVWLNWLLFVVNLLPAFPFDGGPALRALLKSVVGSTSAIVYTPRVAMLIGFALLLTAWFARDMHANAVVPAWPALTILAVFLLFSAQRDAVRFGKGAMGDAQAAEFHGEILDATCLAEFESEEAVLVQQSPRHQGAENGTLPSEIYEEAQLDDVLARLHESSLDALSAEDRRLLLEASRRYRRRRQERRSPESE